MDAHNEPEITQDVVHEAKKNPNGWVYKIEGEFGPNDHVPPECVVGAWKVDASGQIAGEFIKNPNYRPGYSR